MKLLIISLLFLSVNIFANETELTTEASSVEYIYTSGRGSGYCDGTPSTYYCYDQVKERSKRDALQAASYTCSNKRGQIDQYTANCNYFCNPYSIPQGEPSQYVQCSSNCSSRCVIQN